MTNPPYHPIVANLLACLDAHQHEQFEERAGMLEFDAGIDRKFAEALALLEIIRLHGWPPTQQE